MKIAGVIVTYNRKELLVKNIDMQKKQTRCVDVLYIIDNHSADGSKEFVEEMFPDEEWIKYIYLNENTGGAGGFSYGTQMAYEDGCDYIWLMDDDGRPFNEFAMNELLEVAKDKHKENPMLLLNSLVTVEGKSLSFGFSMKESLEDQFYKISSMKKPDNFLAGHANPFNGTLVSKETVEKVGYPNKCFFIARDETDYFRRCQDKNVLIGTVTTSLYHHPNGALKGMKLGKITIPLIDNPEKQYYWVRNLSYSYKDNHKVRMVCYDILILLGILLYQDKKKLRLSNWREALKDAYNNNMGKRELESNEKCQI